MEKLENLHIKDFKIFQDKEKFCWGIDAVLLSDFAECHKNTKCADLGTGNAIIPILMAAKNPAVKFYGVEIQKEIAYMAVKSVEINKLENQITIFNEDIKNVFSVLEKNSFDYVTSNPPYMKTESAVKNSNDAKSIARHEILCTLDDVVKAAAGLLKSQGKFFMIHRPNRLSEIFKCCEKYNLEPKRLQMIHPAVNKAPTMILIEAVKNAKSDLRILKPLFVYNENNSYTDEILKIYGKTTSSSGTSDD
jgi:tRNA1Val (adenine37-N6)-methyltransferase